MDNPLIILLVLVLVAGLIYAVISLGVFGSVLSRRKKPGDAHEPVHRGATTDPSPNPRTDEGRTER